ncbi:MAG: hypothetical protein IPJ71_19185 [Bdellovibrionales bacterium]|nr:hypothetical protein [Bdellovibrionales bacterium]
MRAAQHQVIWLLLNKRSGADFSVVKEIVELSDWRPRPPAGWEAASNLTDYLRDPIFRFIGCGISVSYSIEGFKVANKRFDLINDNHVMG